MDLTTLFAPLVGVASMEQVALALLLTFSLAQGLSWVYERTYEGLSYSRSFVQSLVLGALVACVLMLAIGDNLARGLGIMGTMALVRFRTNVRDPRDMAFVFGSLAVGVACGVSAYAIALMGSLAFSLAAAFVSLGPVGHRQRYDGLLRFWMARDRADGEAVRATLSEHCRDFVLVALRDLAQGDALEYAYQVRLRRPGGQDRLVQALEKLPGLGGLNLLVQEAHTEL